MPGAAPSGYTPGGGEHSSIHFHRTALCRVVLSVLASTLERDGGLCARTLRRFRDGQRCHNLSHSDGWSECHPDRHSTLGIAVWVSGKCLFGSRRSVAAELCVGAGVIVCGVGALCLIGVGNLFLYRQCPTMAPIGVAAPHPLAPHVHGLAHRQSRASLQPTVHGKGLFQGFWVFVPVAS